MRTIVLLLAAGFLAGAPAFAQPPREESPAPRENLEAFGAGSSDEELARAIAEAEAHPLGTLQNPIRTGGPAGADAYLVRLRCPDGSAPVVTPRATGGVGAFGSVTDLHRIACGAAGPTTELVFDLYHEGHVENRAPAGFGISPARP